MQGCVEEEARGCREGGEGTPKEEKEARRCREGGKGRRSGDVDLEVCQAVDRVRREDVVDGDDPPLAWMVRGGGTPL